MNTKKICVFIFLCIALVSCTSSVSNKNLPISSEKIPSEYEYIGDIVVIKEGYHFLWFIPFAKGTEEAAKKLMKDKAIVYLPEADGLYEYFVSSKEEVEFFDWTPRVIIMAKAVKKYNK